MQDNTTTTTTSTQAKAEIPVEALLALGRLNHLNLASNKRVTEMRADLPPGEYRGTVDVTLAYDIKIGEDHEAKVAAGVPWKAIAGALFGKLNPATRDKMVRELLEANPDGGFQVNPTSVNAEAELALQTLMGHTTKTVKGKITGNAMLVEVK